MATISPLTKAPFREANAELSRATLADLGRRYAAGDLTAEDFRAGMAAEIREASAAAFRFALGRAPTVPEANDLAGLLARQGSHLDGFLADLAQGGLSEAYVSNRASLYAGATTEADALGKLAGADRGMTITWNGPDAESACETCARLVGQSWTVEEFRALGVRPGQGTECGPRCRCFLTTGEG